MKVECLDGEAAGSHGKVDGTLDAEVTAGNGGDGDLQTSPQKVSSKVVPEGTTTGSKEDLKSPKQTQSRRTTAAKGGRQRRASISEQLGSMIDDGLSGIGALAQPDTYEMKMAVSFSIFLSLFRLLRAHFPVVY